jgi:GntR family transcriptional regulator
MTIILKIQKIVIYMAQKQSSTHLDVSGPDPLYKQVGDRILQCLVDGEWKPGEQLPTESQLAERLGVAVFTIRAGIGDLVAANILVRKQGKGTFVARHSRQRQRYQFSHIHDTSDKQILPGRELLAFSKIMATGREAEKLGLLSEEKATIYKLKMLSVEMNRAVATLDIALPSRMFKGLTASAIRNAQENLYAAYQDECGVNVIRIEESIYAGLATVAEANALKLRASSPVLRVERIAYTYRNLPVEYRTRVFDATKYHYRAIEGSV